MKMKKDSTIDKLAKAALRQCKLAEKFRKLGDNYEAAKLYLDAADNFQMVAENSQSTAERLDYLETQKTCLMRIPEYSAGAHKVAVIKLKEVDEEIDVLLN
jgi:hypothetical protein